MDKTKERSVEEKRKGWDSFEVVVQWKKRPKGEAPSFRPIRADHLPECDWFIRAIV